jgi:ribosomal-protein-alanine N-acetyltransferase
MTVIDSGEARLSDTPDPHADAAGQVRSATPADLADIARVSVALFGGTGHSYPFFVIRQLFDVFGDQCLVVSGPVDGFAPVCGFALIGTRADSRRVLLAWAVDSDDPALAAVLYRRVAADCDGQLPVSPGTKAYKRFQAATDPGTGLLPALTEPDSLVRMAEIDDLPRLAVVDRAVFCELAYPYFVLCQLFDLFQPYCVLAQSDGEVAGYALVGVTPDRGTAWLLGLGVVPGHRGKGLGALLLDAALDLCRGSGIPDVMITVRPTNEDAYRIYKRAGFVQKDYEAAYFGENQPRSLLHLALRPAETVRPEDGCVSHL